MVLYNCLQIYNIFLNSPNILTENYNISLAIHAQASASARA